MLKLTLSSAYPFDYDTVPLNASIFSNLLIYSYSHELFPLFEWRVAKFHVQLHAFFITEDKCVYVCYDVRIENRFFDENEVQAAATM